ncbi:hypothetical protein E9529_04535 [Blastococcus sp. KM273128]|nr:hypothetical protein [Blastococcus sp. KM273128]
MYVAPTPFALTKGTAGQYTLIAPAGVVDDPGLDEVGTLVRTETESIIVGYEFDLQTNKLTPRLASNPTAGREHTFTAYRLGGTGSGAVSMQSRDEVLRTLEQDVAQ